MSTSPTDAADIAATQDARSGATSEEALFSLPPPPATSSSAGPVRARPGDLTPRWRVLLGSAWIAAFFAYAAVWQASVQIGIGTWWTGPRADPPMLPVRILPFVLCLVIALFAIYNVPRLVQASAWGVLLAVIGSVPDFSRSVGLGITELVIAVLLAVVTASSLTGRYRRAPADALLPPPASPTSVAPAPALRAPDE